MENQHRKIAGYRELSQGEIDLMNEIKAMGPQLEALVHKVSAHVTMQTAAAEEANTESAASEEYERIQKAQPDRWCYMAMCDLQTGLMALTRAVAQPTFF